MIFFIINKDKKSVKDFSSITASSPKVHPKVENIQLISWNEVTDYSTIGQFQSAVITEAKKDFVCRDMRDRALSFYGIDPFLEQCGGNNLSLATMSEIVNKTFFQWVHPMIGNIGCSPQIRPELFVFQYLENWDQCPAIDETTKAKIRELYVTLGPIPRSSRDQVRICYSITEVARAIIGEITTNAARRIDKIFALEICKSEHLGDFQTKLVMRYLNKNYEPLKAGFKSKEKQGFSCTDYLKYYFPYVIQPAMIINDFEPQWYLYEQLLKNATDNNYVVTSKYVPDDKTRPIITQCVADWAKLPRQMRCTILINSFRRFNDKPVTGKKQSMGSTKFGVLPDQPFEQPYGIVPAAGYDHVPQIAFKEKKMTWSWNRDEYYPSTIIYRHYLLSLWGGPSGHGTGNVQFIYTKIDNMTPVDTCAILTGLFAFWRLYYDKRISVVHTLAETMESSLFLSGIDVPKIKTGPLQYFPFSFNALLDVSKITDAFDLVDGTMQHCKTYIDPIYLMWCLRKKYYALEKFQGNHQKAYENLQTQIDALRGELTNKGLTVPLWSKELSSKSGLSVRSFACMLSESRESISRTLFIEAMVNDTLSDIIDAILPKPTQMINSYEGEIWEVVKSKLLTDLYNNLIKQGKTVVLDKNCIADDTFLSNWKTILNTDTLKISDAVLSAQDEYGNFTISGNAPLMQFGSLNMKIDFFVSYDMSKGGSEEVQCVIRLDQTIALWNLSSDYPDMPGYIDYSDDKVGQGYQDSFLKQINFKDTAFCYSSYNFWVDNSSYQGDKKLDGEILKLGINYTSDISTDDAFWDTVKQITNTLGIIGICGNITAADKGILLRVGHEFDLSFGISDTLQVKLKKLEISSGLSKGLLENPAFSILCELDTISPALELKIDIGVGRNTIGISGFFVEGRVLTLADIAQALGLKDLVLSSFLPNGYSESYFGTLGLKNFDLSMNISPARVQSFSFIIEAANPWIIINNAVSVQPFFSFEIQNPFEGNTRETALKIIGKWKLGTTDFYTCAMPLTGDFSAFMKDNETLDISALTSTLIEGITLPKIELEKMKFAANFFTNVYYVELQAATNFEFDLGICSIDIMNVGFLCYYDGSKLQDLSLNGVFTLAGICLEIDGSYNSDSQWTIRGGIPVDTTINFGSVFTNILSDLNISSAQLPQLIPEKCLTVEISSLYIEYQSNTQSLTTFVDLISPLTITDQFKIDEVAIQLHFDPKGLRDGFVKMNLTILSIDIILTLEKNESGWLFTGSTGPDQKIPIGSLIADLTSKFLCDIEVPECISGFVIQNINLSYKPDSENMEFQFTCEGIVPIDDKELDIVLTIKLSNSKDGYTFSLEGCFKIDNLTFTIDFELSKGTSYLVAAFDPKDECIIHLKDVISSIWSQAGEIIPDSLEIKLKDVFFVLASETEQDKSSGLKMLFGVEVGAQFDLSQVQVLGTLFQQGTEIGIDNLQALILTKPMSDKLLKSINETLSKISSSKFKILPKELKKEGFYITSIFNFAGYKPQVELPIVKSDSSEKTTALTAIAVKETTPAASSDHVHWCNINKTVGPIQLRRIGILLDGNDTKFEVDISLVTASFEIDLLGLWIGVDISDPFGKLPSFGIHGLNVTYAQPPVYFNGGLLYVENPMEGYLWEINGQLMVKYNQYGFFADASYAQPKQGTTMSSFFAFLMVSAPIGGPPYLYVSGLAGGFGFNRNLIVPDASHLTEFPLVQGALGKGNLTSGMKADEALKKMDVYVPPKEFDYWLAAGVAVGSCHIINAFVMVAGVFGTDFDLAVIGIATAEIPTGESPQLIARIELALVGNINPMSGSIEITGALTSNSYIFAPECKLTGGFAYCIWLEKGDFVVSIGGYSPSFKKPSYYPALDLLGINWKISSNLSMKGGAYCAYTPSCAMAGGALDLDFRLGSLRAWLTAHADFLMEWLPFHYDVSIGVQIGVSLTVSVWFVHKKFNLEIGADLHIWGPEFTGEAKVKLWIVSFTISFGASQNQEPPKLNWDEFYNALLSGNSQSAKRLGADNATPPDVININISEGLIAGISNGTGQKDYWVVSPNKFEFKTHSTIPAKSASIKNTKSNHRFDLSASNTDFGIRPMGLSSVDTEHIVTLKKKQGDGTWADVDLTYITYETYNENLPDALWSSVALTEPSAGTQNATVGITIKSLDASYYTVPPSGSVSTEVFMFEPLNLMFSWGNTIQPTNPAYTEDPMEKLKASIQSEPIVDLRNSILASLKKNGFQVPETVELSDYKASAENILQAEPKLYELGAKG